MTPIKKSQTAISIREIFFATPLIVEGDTMYIPSWKVSNKNVRALKMKIFKSHMHGGYLAGNPLMSKNMMTSDEMKAMLFHI